MPRFMYTIISFVFFSGLFIYYIVATKDPSKITIFLVLFFLILFIGFFISLIMYFFNIKFKKVVFPFNPRKVYRRILVRSFVVAFVVGFLLYLQIYGVLDLITFLLLTIFVVVMWVFLSAKKDVLDLA